jgi:hypothetical protein
MKLHLIQAVMRAGLSSSSSSSPAVVTVRLNWAEMVVVLLAANLLLWLMRLAGPQHFLALLLLANLILYWGADLMAIGWDVQRVIVVPRQIGS